jgi:DNA polymerase III subunit delta
MASFTINEFIKSIQNFDEKNLFLFHGAESFFIDYLLDKITERSFKNPSDKDLNYHKFYGTENGVAEIIAACMSYPMLAEKKLVIVKEYDRLKIKKDEGESLLKYFENPPTSTRLVLTATKMDNKSLTQKLLKNSVSVQCKSLNTGELYAWVVKRYQDAEIEVEREMISFLIENIGNDLLRLNQEIEKSIDFAGESKNVSLELISELTGFNREVNIFNFQRVLGGRNLKESLKIGLQLLEQQNAIELVIAMVYRFFRQVIVLKQLTIKGLSKSEILKKTGEREFALKDAFASINNFTMDELIFIFERIQEADLFLKSSERKKESILTMLCYYICNPTKKDFN